MEWMLLYVVVVVNAGPYWDNRRVIVWRLVPNVDMVRSYGRVRVYDRIRCDGSIPFRYILVHRRNTYEWWVVMRMRMDSSRTWTIVWLCRCCYHCPVVWQCKWQYEHVVVPYRDMIGWSMRLGSNTQCGNVGLVFHHPNKYTIRMVSYWPKYDRVRWVVVVCCCCCW